MIAARHVWLLRDEGTCFDDDGGCRVCRTQERGEVKVPRGELHRHLANHRREAIDRAPAERPDLLLETLA